ncbi:DeoR family transcriptional regulator [Halobacteriales archaeon QS_4_62_28]|nr:MAG: DeoR family transcriptional regulator [Halobacteriales archaeon QS_4_62_28]
MLPEERRRRIVELVTVRDGCRVEDLSGQLDVSETTVRRDLDYLDDQNLIERTHGGAMPVVDRVNEYDKRKIQNQDAKRAIAQRAVDEIHEEQVVAFGAGSTTLEVTTAVPEDLPFSVLTNHPTIAYQLGDSKAEVRLTGGRFQKDHQRLTGPLAEQAIEQMNFDLAFVGTEGIDAEAGFTTAYHDAARLKELMIANSQRAVVLADHSKLDSQNIVQFCDFSDIDLVITDETVSDEIRETLAAHDVTIAIGER